MLKKDDAKNIELLLAKKEIKKRFEKILTDLRKTVERNGYAVQTIERFRGCLNINVTKLADGEVVRLPFFSVTLFSRQRNKINCILCLVSYTIQKYWEFCVGDQEQRYVINSYLCDLENYAAKGLAAFKIVGTRYPDGYYLEEK